MKRFFAAIIILFALYMWSSRMGIDGYELEYFLSAGNLIRNRTLSMPSEPLNVPGVSERAVGIYHLPRHNLIQVFLTVPLYIAGMPFNALFTPASSGVMALPMGSLAAVSVLNPLLTIAAVIFLYLIGQKLGYPPATCRLIAGLYAIATMAWPYAAIGMEPLQTALMLLCFLIFLNVRKQMSLPGILLLAVAIACLMHTKISAPLVALPVATATAILLLKSPRKFAAPLSVFLVVMGVSSAIWFAIYQFRKQGMYTAGFFANFNAALVPRNIAGMLLSPGKSLFVYNPILIVCLGGIPRFWRKHTLLAFVMVLTGIATLVLTAFWDWSLIEESWGPRYLMPLVPILMLMGIDRFQAETFRGKKLRKIVFALLIILSVCVQIPGVLYPNVCMLLSVQTTDIPVVDLATWVPDLSPVPVGWHLMANQIRQSLDQSMTPLKWNYYRGIVGQGAKPVVIEFDNHGYNRPYPILFLIGRYIQRTDIDSSLEYPDSKGLFVIWLLTTAALLAGFAACFRDFSKTR